MHNALVIGSRKAEFETNLEPSLRKHGIEVGALRMKNNASSDIPAGTDVVVCVTDINRLPTLAALVKRNAKRVGVPVVSVPHRWSRASSILIRAGFPEIVNVREVAETKVKLREIASPKSPLNPVIAPGTLELPVSFTYPTYPSKTDVYDWVIRTIAGAMWLTNPELKEQGLQWSESLGFTGFPQVGIPAGRAREALGILSMGRIRGPDREITLEEEKYQSMCQALGVVPNFGNRVKSTTGDAHKIATSKRETFAEVISQPAMSEITEEETPDPVRHRGVYCSVQRRRGKTNAGYSWKAQVGRNYVCSWRAHAEDIPLLIDDALAAGPNDKIRMKIETLVAQAALKSGSVPSVAVAPVAPVAPIAPASTDPASTALEAIESLSSLVWDVMASHGIVALSFTPDGLDYEIEVRSTVTRSLSRVQK